MIEWKKEWKKLALIVGAFLACFYLPVHAERFRNAIMESLELVRWYAREHVLLCLIPAFFIAGAISVFVSQAAVMKYLGAKAHKALLRTEVRMCGREHMGRRGADVQQHGIEMAQENTVFHACRFAAPAFWNKLKLRLKTRSPIEYYCNRNERLL